jgi:hypothetical protein
MRRWPPTLGISSRTFVPGYPRRGLPAAFPWAGTALDRPDRLYAKLVATLTVPGSMQPGLDHLLEVFLPGSREAEDLLDWAQDELHPKVWAVLFNRIKGQRISEEQTSFLDQDLMGAFIPMQELKAIHRLNFRNSLRMESRFRLKDHAFDYYRLVERMIVLAGYRGWVILIDEAELIGRLGIGGRAASYAQLGRLLGATGELNRTFTVVGVASTFLAEVLSGRRDREQAPQWLRDRGRLEEAKLAEFALERLADAELLRSLNRTQLQQAIEIILAAHQEAYRWSADIAGERLLKLVEDATPGEDVKLRTRIRAAIQILDMLFQYGRVPQLVLQRLVEEDYREQNDE